MSNSSENIKNRLKMAVPFDLVKKHWHNPNHISLPMLGSPC